MSWLSEFKFCPRCKHTLYSPGGWYGVLEKGVLVGEICSGCLTPEELAEAKANDGCFEVVS